MAVTQQPTERERQPWAGISEDTEGKRILRWFERAIWHDRRTCSHCFAALRRVDELEKDDWGNVVQVSEYCEAAVEGFDKEDPPESVPSAIPLARERTTCGECGSVGGLAQSDPLSKQAAVDRVPALVTRLEERGHSVDLELVYATVRHLKSAADYQDDDKRVFAAAAGRGIKHG